MTQAATTTERRPWQLSVSEALQELAPTEDEYVVVWLPRDPARDAELVARAADEESAISIAGDVAERFDGEISTARIDDVLSSAAELDVEPQRANEEAAPPVREVPAEPEPDASPDVEKEEEDDEKPLPEGKIFDDSDYEREDLAIPKVDGESIDKIRVAFSGSVMLDRSDPADVALYNKLRLGKDVELRCAGKVAGNGTGFTTNKDGDLDVVVGEKKIKVETVWVLEPENLAA